jgi:hypothetical protein
MPIPNLSQLMEITKLKEYPVSYSWSRLEGRPRGENFDRALKAEVRDALWMLTKQWQLGEFEGDDAGSPVTAKIHMVSRDIDRYKADDQSVQAFDKDVPFEAKVEQRRFPFATLQQEISLDLRLVMGRRWFQLLDDQGVLTAAVKTFFINEYGFRIPDPTKTEDAFICAHPDIWQSYAAVAGRMMDGASFFFDLDIATVHYYDRPAFPLATDHDKFDTAESNFRKWFKDVFYQPDEAINNAWNPARLEYQFSISTHDNAVEKVMKGDQYYHGHLDWYNVDVDKKTQSLDPTSSNDVPSARRAETLSVIPTPVMFEGMPNTRWWAFEDGKTNFGYIKPDTTDLSKLLMIEFGLIYANDWYLLPYVLPVGTITSIKGLTLTNSFGENFWIDRAGTARANEWNHWNLFSMHVSGEKPDSELLLLPTVSKIQQSKPVEEILFVRDEVANMVWGVETIIPMANGWSRSGFETARELNAWMQQLVINALGGVLPPDPPLTLDTEEAKIKYNIMSMIPENWIPFVPAHVDDSNREVQLQRASLPRILEGQTTKPDKVRPRTSLLQTGLDEKAAYFIYEEEVPRAGVYVTQSFQRTRGTDGKIYVWFGAQKTVGRGEGSSGLAFDQILAKKGE